MKNVFLFVSILVYSGVCLASESAGHGSITDLIAPAINVVLLGGFLLLKIRKPLKNFFEDKSKKVSQLLDRAEVKSKEAQVMLEMYQKKMKEISKDIDEIYKEREDEVAVFAKNHREEVQNRVEQLKAETLQVIEAEKNTLVTKVNKALLDDVLNKAKNIIASNSQYKKSVTKRLLEDMPQ